jgi:hypothetical protein
MEIVIYKYGNMANGACFKYIAKIYVSLARKVAVLPLCHYAEILGKAPKRGYLC